jgi:ribosome-binding protein aMBF1 (putative translation factor)
MKKGTQKPTGGVDNKQKEFDDIFAKFAQQLPKDYVQQFKRPESTAGAKQVKLRTAQRQGKVEVVQKTTGNKKGEIANIGKLLEDDGIIEIKTTPKEVAQQVAKFRNEHKLTQDQLAKKISEPLQDLNDLENCTGPYKPNLVSKIEKFLNVKIDRPWKNKN